VCDPRVSELYIYLIHGGRGACSRVAETAEAPRGIPSRRDLELVSLPTSLSAWYSVEQVQNERAKGLSSTPSSRQVGARYNDRHPLFPWPSHGWADKRVDKVPSLTGTHTLAAQVAQPAAHALEGSEARGGDSLGGNFRAHQACKESTTGPSSAGSPPLITNHFSSNSARGTNSPNP
jgi:hypothetical protein